MDQVRRVGVAHFGRAEPDQISGAAKVDPPCRGRGHPAAAAPRAEAAALASEGHEAVVVAARAAQPCEAVGRVTAPEEALEFVEDMARQGSARCRQRLAERSEALPHHRVEQVGGGTPELDDAGHEARP